MRDELETFFALATMVVERVPRLRSVPREQEPRERRDYHRHGDDVICGCAESS